MPRSRLALLARWVFLAMIPGFLDVSPPDLRAAPPARHARGMVASVHPLATQAGVEALRQGGNAVDAAVAVALTLGVVDSHNSGIGGGCFILLRTPRGEFFAWDGRETAPAQATRDMFLKAGKAESSLSTTGPLAVATPGALAAYAAIVKQHGRLALAELLRPGADLAERGFAIDRVMANSIRSTQDELAKFPAARAIWLHPDGTPLREGDRLVQPDLARTYRAIAAEGPDWFYRGSFARQVGEWMAAQGGILAASDFSAYTVRSRTPLQSQYRGYTIVGFPPPSSGGVHVAQILNILEPFDLRAIYAQDRAQFTHVVAEAMKLAFADRAHWLGDPGFAPVPRGLVDQEYGRSLAQRIELRQAAKGVQHGTPPRANQDLFHKHTTHVAAADAEGYWVAITATINTSFGSKVVVPGTGVVLNNEMDDFSIQPGVPNAFGLVGAEANAVAPGKTPLSSMSPTIVLQNNEPILTIGAAGGPTIISQVVLGLVRHLDLGLPLDEALLQPRFHHQWSPDVLTLEKGTSAELAGALQKLGHVTQERDRIGVSQAISWSPQERVFYGVHDPRVPGLASGP